MILTTTQLAISYRRENNDLRYFLNNVSDASKLEVHNFITPVNIYSVILTKEFAPLLERLDWQIKIKLGIDQLMVVSFFYLSSQPYSPSVIKHWLGELNCSDEYAEKIVEILYSARLEKLDFDPYEITGVKDYKFIASDNEIPSITYLLEECNKDQPLTWKYDNLEQSTNHHLVRDLSKLNETAFLVEDHGCIVVGFSVNITELIQLASGYKTETLSILSGLVPLHLRDHYSVGRLVIDHPEVINQLMESCFSAVTFHGLLPNGNLSTFETCSLINQGTTIPLFLKLIK